LAEIEAQDITDNVVEFMLRQLQKLSEVTQQILFDRNVLDLSLIYIGDLLL